MINKKLLVTICLILFTLAGCSSAPIKNYLADSSVAYLQNCRVEERNSITSDFYTFDNKDNKSSWPLVYPYVLQTTGAIYGKASIVEANKLEPKILGSNIVQFNFDCKYFYAYIIDGANESYWLLDLKTGNQKTYNTLEELEAVLKKSDNVLVNLISVEQYDYWLRRGSYDLQY